MSIFIDSKESERGKIILKMGKKEKQLRFYDDEDGGDNSITVASLKKMFTNLLVSELVFEARVGDKNALNTIMLISSVRLIFYSTVSILKSRHNLNIHEKFIPCFNKDIFTMDAYGILNISLADIIFGIIMNAVEKDSKVELEEKGNSNDN